MVLIFVKTSASKNIFVVRAACILCLHKIDGYEEEKLLGLPSALGCLSAHKTFKEKFLTILRSEPAMLNGEQSAYIML